jgi:ubiquinol-cytochrome c reductase cytochrome b subunit
MKKILLSLLAALGFLLPLAPAAADEGGYPWDSFPRDKMTDLPALQNGARIFTNYCLNCHSARYMRYNRLHDIYAVSIFLFIFSAVLFFAPEGGGYFLEFNNFIEATPLKTPPHIAPVWYFTPFYSMLRATTDIMVNILAAILAIGAVLAILRGGFRGAGKIGIAVAAIVAVFLLKYFDAKFWGVVVMGSAVLILFLLPWLDRSPVKSIRYKGRLYKTALTIFVIAFLVLGYFGTQPVTDVATFIAQFFTVLYFAFFALMPWYSRLDKTRPEPTRVTG